MKASLRYYRISPRKMRIVADAIRGKNAGEARVLLGVLNKRAAPVLRKLLDSAVANARQQGVETPEQLVIKEIRVDKGVTLRRFMPRAFGRATPINKETSNVILILGEAPQKRNAAPAETEAATEETPAAPEKAAQAAHA